MADNKILIGVALIALIVIGAFAVGAIKLPFAAIPSSRTLPDVTQGQTVTKTLTVSVASDSKAISNFWYSIDYYGPNADTTSFSSATACYPAGCAGIATGTSIAAGSSKTFSIQIPSSLDTGNKYAVLIATGDGGRPTDVSKWSTMAGSQYDTQYQSSCNSNPTAYGCMDSNKATCCLGTGYWFNVLAAPATQYKGTVTVS